MLPTNLVKASIFTALAVGAGYALLLVPNVELMTAIIFCGGAWLGISWGIIIGVTAQFIFSAMHPLGSGLAVPPLLLAQVISMALVGLAGGVSGAWLSRHLNFYWGRLTLAGIGFLLTFVYDSLTTISFPLAAGFEWPQTVAIYLSGLGFTVLHQLGNALVFFVGVPKIIDSQPYRDDHPQPSAQTKSA